MWNLSAVDAHVGKHLFEECITTFLRNKVVILVTHQIQYLKTADNILVLHQGRVSHEGNFDYIMKSCEDISSFLIAESDEEEEDDKETKQVEITEGNSQPVKKIWIKSWIPSKRLVKSSILMPKDSENQKMKILWHGK